MFTYIGVATWYEQFISLTVDNSTEATERFWEHTKVFEIKLFQSVHKI